MNPNDTAEIIPGKTKFGLWTVVKGPFQERGWSKCICECVCKERRTLYTKNLESLRTSSCKGCESIRKLVPVLERLVGDRLAEMGGQLEAVQARVSHEVCAIRAEIPDVQGLRSEVRDLRDEIPTVAGRPQVFADPAGDTIPFRPAFQAEQVDFEALRQRVRAMLDPAQDDSRWSVRSLRKQLPPTGYDPRPTVDQLRRSFEYNKYFLTSEQIFAIHQAISQGMSILADGPPGAGKSELARQICLAMGLSPEDPYQFHTLFCTPDIAKAEALYNWDDSKRILDIQLLREVADKFPVGDAIDIFREAQENAYGERYLNVQSLLRPCVLPFRTVCLGDEIDKTYPEFDSYLLDVVAQNRFEVPGYGPLGRGRFDRYTSPIFVFTSNRLRELSGPLSRRLVPVWFDYLPEKLETRVLVAKCGLDEMAAGRAAQFFFKVRSQSIRFRQPPSTAEVIATCNALVADRQEISVPNLFRYHFLWAKYRQDYNAVRERYYLSSSASWKDSV